MPAAPAGSLQEKSFPCRTRNPRDGEGAVTTWGGSGSGIPWILPTLAGERRLMELTVTLQPTDRYRPATLGEAGPAVVYVERDGATDLAFIAETTEMRRLARARPSRRDRCQPGATERRDGD